MHVLFDETNSLIENNAQDEEFELGLVRKDLFLIHEKGKCPMNGSGPGAISSEGGQSLNQSGESTAESSLEQTQSNFPRTGLETGPEQAQEQATEQAQKQVPKQDQKQGPEQVLNLFHRAVQE